MDIYETAGRASRRNDQRYRVRKIMTMIDRGREYYRNGRDGRRRLSRQDTLLYMPSLVGSLVTLKKNEGKCLCFFFFPELYSRIPL